MAGSSEKSGHKRVSIEARRYLAGLGQGYHQITGAAKKSLERSPHIESKFRIYSGAFDMIQLPSQGTVDPIDVLTPEDCQNLKFIEVKASDKNLKQGLKGHFFSLQYAEQLMAQNLGSRYLIAFVVIPRNGESPFHEILTWQEIWSRAKAMHMQWSIQF